MSNIKRIETGTEKAMMAARKAGDSVDNSPDPFAFQVVEPPRHLQKAINPGGKAGMDLDAIKRGETGLEELAEEFNAWMDSDLEALNAARDALTEAGVTQETVAGIYRAAHGLRGAGQTYGFPLLTQLGDSLCRLIDTLPDPTKIPVHVFDSYVEAAIAMYREQQAAIDSQLGQSMLTALLDLADQIGTKLGEDDEAQAQ